MSLFGNIQLYLYIAEEALVPNILTSRNKLIISIFIYSTKNSTEVFLN